MLYSPALFLATRQLAEQAAIIQQTRWRRLDYLQSTRTSDLRGNAVDTALTNLESAAESLQGPITQMRQVSEVLAQFYPLFRRIEQLEANIHQLRMTAVGIALEPLTAQLRALGEALDFACARNIDALCTPTYAPAPATLADFADLPLATIHEIAFASTTPEIAQLAADNEDLTLLEAAGGGLVALIDPDDLGTQAASITTFVGGVGSSDRLQWPQQVERARTLARATGGPTALWLGYNAPPSLARAVHSQPAEAGARDLARFQRALSARFPKAQKVVVGYSYGSVVAGRAALDGNRLIADDLVLVGSPGAGAAHANEFQLEGAGRVHAVSSVDDPIRLTGSIHGTDPTKPSFGAQPWPQLLRGGHSSYWDNPAFLSGLGALTHQNKPVGSSE